MTGYGKSWVEDEYGALLSPEEACKVLRMSRAKLAACVRYKKILVTRDPNDDSKYWVSSKEVQHILDDPKRREEVFGGTKAQKAAERAPKDTNGVVQPEVVDKVVEVLKPLLGPLIEQEVEKQRIVFSRRERVIEKQVPVPVESGGEDIEEKKEASREDLVGTAPWQRPNSGTERFPVYI